MLQKKAEENGYLKADYFGNGSWAAPTAVVDNAEDFSNLDALQEYIDDYGGEVNVYGIINGIQGHDENYYFDPSRAGFHGQAASDTAQVYRKLRYDKAGPDTEVTVYRAVPNDINGEKLMRGDWIALSKNYCEEHGNGRYGEGNFHIIEEKVAIKNIWQGEEDMREFGFDDGKSDVEKNVSNNRKLLEITYDDNGNLIPLSQRFNEQNPSILFQEEKTLAGIHNLSEENLQHVFKMGGLANPSMAVIDTASSDFTNFGDISLVAPKSLIAKTSGNNAGTFGADIYSPRYPSINVEVTDKGSATIKEIIKDIEDDTFRQTVKERIKQAMEDNRPYNANRAFAVPFLLEKGDKSFYVIPEMDLDADELELYNKAVAADVYSPIDMTDEMKNDFTEMYLNKEIEKHKEKYPDWDQKDIDYLNESLRDEDTGYLNSRLFFNYWDHLRTTVRKAGQVDEYKTLDKAKELVESEKYKDEFDAYKKEKIASIDKKERIFNGYTPSGNRRWLDHTLENVSKFMKQQSTRGGETFSYGMGSTRARVAPKWTTLEQIAKNKDRLVSKDEFETVKAELESTYDELTDIISDGNGFDAGEARLNEALESVNPLSYLKREYDIDFSDDEKEMFTSFIEALKKMPTEYFETKFNRPVYMNEFYGAVIPRQTSQEVKDKLQEAGLTIKEYDDPDTRMQLIRQMGEAANGEILFQEAEPGTEFQTVYHGSPHILKKAGGQLIRGEELGFDHSKMGTGEGAQAFGWGSYVTQVEGIADDYARKLTSVPGTLFVSLEGKKDFIKQRKASLRNLDNGKYEERINKNIRNFTKELKAAQKAQDNDEIKFYEDLIKTSQEDLNPEAKEKYREAFLKDIEKTEAEIKELKAQIKEAEKAIANVYTLEIPSDSENYIQWDKEITPLQYDRIVKQAEAENLKLYSGEDLYSVSEYGLTTTNGEKLYHELIKETKKTDKEISQFLNRAGFTGISYPANATTGGREDGARNFVIFNEDDITITEWHGKDKNGNMLFQETIPQSILNEAAQFESWMEYRDFMEATNMGTEGVPVDASADWYLNTWEIAHNVSPTTAERNAAEMQEKKEQRDAARRDPIMVDAEWYTMIKKPGNLEAFLKLIYQATHIDQQEMASLNEEEAAYVQDIINRAERMFHHGVYSGNITRVHNGKELTNKARETMLTLMGQRKRDYRAIYADITGQSEYFVEKSDLQKENAKIAKDALRYKLITYASEVDAMSPEEKTKLLNQIKDESIREKFKKDNVKMVDPDVEHYISMLESDLKTRNKELAAMRTDFNEDVERFASKQERDIIKQFEQYLIAKNNAESRKIPLPAGSKNAERVGAKFERQVQSGMKHSFTEMVQDWDVFKTELEANIKIQERLRAENRLAELEEKIRSKYNAQRVKTLMNKAETLNAMSKEYSQKQQEVAAAKKLREMRKALVKRVMRRVNFNTIDYNRAKQIIAVQKVFDPNLRGGINKWIGTENKLAREVWSAWNTDFEAKENMLKRLSNRGKLDVIRLLEQTKTEEDFEKLTKKEQKMIERAMPRQDWIKELKLDIWKDERDNALQLPIKEITETQYVTQADGTKKPVEVTRVEFPSEIEELLVQSIGQDMTYAIQYRHFEDWTTGDMEELARRMDKMFKEGRDMLAARREAERIQADRIRERIREAINNTGIVINEDDPEDVKKKKQAKIDKILGVNQQLPGSTGSKKEKQQTFIDRLLHSYHDANIRRVARMLDNFSEGELTNLLYWQENDCFNREERAKSRRNAKIDEAIQNNKLDMRKLGKVIEFNGTKYTWDDVLMVWAAK